MSIQRPKLNSSGLNDSDHKSLVSELTKYAEEGASDADLKEFRNTFITQKKKGTPLPESTAPPQKLVSGTPTGSSVGVKPKAPTKVVENATQKEQRLRKELSNVKVTSANMDAVSAKTDELSALQKANSKAAKQKLDATDNNIISKIFSTNKQGIDNAFKSEEDDNEVSDYIREGAKKALNVAGGIVNTFPKGVNALSGHTLNLPTIDKFEPKIPFGTQLKEVDAETAERKKQDPNYFVNDVDRMALAKEKFGVQAVKQQHLENAAELLNDQDPEVQIRIKSKIINSIKGTTATSKAISAQIQVLDNQATPLSNEIAEMEKTIKGGKYTEQFAKDYETKKASFNAISEQYLGLLDDAKKNDNENLTAQERLEVFKLDFNPFVKAADDIVGGFGKLGGDALYAMGKGSDVINETFGVKGREKGDSVFTKGAEVLLTDAENRQAAHPHIKVTDINGFTDLGGWVGQTVGAVAPFAVGMAIGSTEASLASKAFLTASPGLMGFSLGAAGGAMSDMDKEMANTPGLDYSNWQYMAKTAGSVGSNALMFGNYAAIFKGNKALFESIGKTPAATVEFKKGFQDYAGNLWTGVKSSNKTGSTMALVSGINMFVDNHVLGKKHEGSFEEIADSYVEGVAMHIGTAEAPKALVFMAEKLLPSPTKKAIRSNLGTIHTLMKEVNNPNLTPQERTTVKNKIFEAHKENTVLLGKSLKDAGKLTGPQINELLIADQNRFDITKKVEEVKKGNFSDEYKKSELNKLKAEFKALDSRTTNVFSDPFNAINILPDAAKRKTEAQRELIKEFNDKNPESNKKIVLEDNEINERALKNYSKELKEEKAVKLEVEKEQAPIVETPVAETPKAEENSLPLQEGETFIESKQDKKGNTYTTVSTVTEKDGVKTTKFSFNRSDKDASQRNSTSVSPEKALEGFDITTDYVPEGVTLTGVYEIREGKNSTGATVEFSDVDGNKFRDEVKLTKKQTASSEVVAEVPQVELNKDIDVSKAVIFESSNGGFFIADTKANHLETDTNGKRVLYESKAEAEAKLDEIQNPPVVEKTTPDTKEPASEDSPVPSVSNNEGVSKEVADVEKRREEAHKALEENPMSTGINGSYSIPEQVEISKDGVKSVKEPRTTKEIDAKYDAELEALKNESTPQGNTPTNGDVQPGVQPVGESGVAKPETPAKEGIPSPVDGGKAKGDVEVENKEDLTVAKEGTKPEKTNESIDVADIKEDSKPNKGDLVDFGEGLEKVIDIVKTRDGKEFIKSTLADGSFDRENLYPLSEWKDVVSKQEKYKNDRTEKAKSDKERENSIAENDKKEQDKLDLRNDTNGFSEKFDKLKAGKVKTVLNKKAQFNGKFLTRKEYIENVIKNGGYVVKERLFKSNGTFMDSKDLTKTGIDYAKHLEEIGFGKPTETPVENGKKIEPRNEVDTDVETVKKELNLNEVDNFIYDQLKDTPKDKVFSKIDKIKDDKFGEIEDVERKIDDIDLKIEDNGEAIDKIEENETLSTSKKKKAVAEKEIEYKDLQKQREDLEAKKEDLNKFILDIDEALIHPVEEYNIDKVTEVIDRVNNRLETRKSVKEGTNLFPEDANIPEVTKPIETPQPKAKEKVVTDENGTVSYVIDKPKVIKLEDNADVWYKYEGKLNGETLYRSSNRLEYDMEGNKLPTGYTDKLLADNKKIFNNNNKVEVVKTPLLEAVLNKEKGWEERVSSASEGIEELQKVQNEIKNNKKLEGIMYPEIQQELNLAIQNIQRKELKNKVNPNKPTPKERVAERVKLSDSKIDAKSEIVKAKLKAFTDMFPSADINPADYKSNGYSMDAVIDMVAKAAKSIAKGGIVTSEHINEAIKAWNEHFDDVIDAKEIEKITNPKEEPLFVDENGDSYTSLKNAVSNPEREAKGKEVVVVRDGKTDAERKQDLHNRIDSGEISKEEIQDITTALANGSVEELVTRHSKADIITILLKDKVSLENRTTEIRQELEANKGTDKEGQSLLDLARNEMLEDQNYLASATLKGEWSEMGRNLQDAMKADFSRPAIIKKLENAAGDKGLSPELRKKAGEMAEEIKQMQTKLDEHQAKYEELDAKYKDKETENTDLQEKISKHEGEKALEKAVKLQGLKTKKEYKIADIEKKQKVVIDRLREKYKNLSGMVNAGINPKFLELAPDVAILAKYEIQKGAVKLEEVIGRVHLQLKDIIPELTERDVRDLFSGYGKSVIPKDVSANEQTLRDLRSKARALSGLQDVKEEGTAPLRSGFKHTTPTPEVLALRREIHREMRARGIDIKNAKDPQAVWKTAIESYKTRTNNRIEYLESIAKSKDIEKYLREKKKTKMKLDDEARQLRVKSQKAKHVVDDMVAELDFEAWSKFRKTRHYGLRYARGILISAPTTLAKILGAAAWRTAFKIPTAVATYGASKLKPGIAKVEGINSAKDLTQHIVDYYKKEFSMTNLKESYRTLTNHASQEEILFGKHHGRIPLPKVSGNKSLNVAQKLFFWNLKFLEDISASSHGALKNLVALPEYEAYKNTIMRNLIKEGIPEDMMNDGSMEQIAHQLAYAKSQRARFGQDNAVSSAKSEWMAKLKNKKHYITADIIDAALPIVKIASNYIGESLEKYPVIGLAGNGKNLFKATDVLSSKEQGHLLRTLAHQGVGAMSMVAGAMMYKNISAFYGTDADDHAKEQNPDLAKHDGAIGFISHLLAHSPDAEAMRVGASFMWYWELYDKKNNADKSIMSDFMLAAIKNTTSIMNQSPYFSTSESLVAPLLDSNFSWDSAGKVGVNFIRPRVPMGDALNAVAQGKIPQLEKLAPELAGKISTKLGMTPETVKPYEVGLRPKGFVNNLKMGIPGWRNELLKELLNESKMPKLKTAEDVIDRHENKFKKIKNEAQFRKEHK